MTVISGQWLVLAIEIYRQKNMFSPRENEFDIHSLTRYYVLDIRGIYKRQINAVYKQCYTTVYKH